MEKVLRVAVVGAGIYGIHHLDAYTQNKRVKLVAVCDLSEKIRKSIEENYRVKTYSDVIEMLENEKLDAVSIATPDAYHLQPAMEALKHGLHILVEKPLATTYDDGLKMVNLAKERGLLLGVDFHKRWDPVAINVREHLKKSDGFPIRGYMSMDDIIAVPTEWFNWGSRSTPTDFLGSHCVDLMRYYMGCEVTQVFATGVKKLLPSMGVDTYDSIQALITFENGCTWTLENSWVLPNGFAKANDGKTFILTSKDFIRIDSQDRGLQIFTEEKMKTPNVFFFNDFNGKQFGFGIEPINDFVDSILDGKALLADGIDGLKAIQITNAILESVRTGQVVTLSHE